MRIAYIGFSSPICYDYATIVKRGKHSDPNPILESPFGLLLLYDELWFASRSLCPKNMRKLKYIKFLDEEGSLPKLSDINFSRYHSILEDNPEFENKYKIAIDSICSSGFQNFINISWSSSLDHHTPSQKVFGYSMNASSFNPALLTLDVEITNFLKNKNIELINNSINQGWLTHEANTLVKILVSEELIVKNIPNYLKQEGPYHPCIEDVRNDKFLVDFRSWITTISKEIDPKKIKEACIAIENRLQEAKDEVFMKQFEPNEYYSSISKTVLGALVETILPVSGSLAAIAQELKRFLGSGKNRWQAFLT